MFNEENATVASAQKVMLEILKEVHKICIDNDITYWIEAGTLLGAVRHKGFIPWDDDIDIAMPRKDYNKFMQIAQDKLPKDMFLQNKITDGDYPLPFAKIRKNNTLLIETGESGDENYHHGIFIDIFPYDNYKYGWFIKWMRWGKLVRDKKKNYRRGSIERILITFWTNIVLLLPVELTKFVRVYFEKHLEYFKNDSYEYFTYGFECCEGSCTKKEDILPVKLGEKIFEGYDFFLPQDVEAVLVAEYGKDYMNLPPVHNRKVHAKKIEV